MEIKKVELSYYYKYLISYIFVLVVPILIIAALVNFIVFKTLEKEIITNEFNALHQVKNEIETNIEQMSQIKNAIYLNSYNSTFLFKDDPLKALDKIKELKSYQLTNSYFDDIFLYYIGDDYIYTSKGSAPLNIFTKDIYSYENWSHEDFIYTLNNIKKPLFRSVEYIKEWDAEDSKYATLLYPLSYISNDPYAVVAFLIPKSFFDIRMNTVLENEYKTTLILNENNEVIVSSLNSSFLKTSEFTQFIQSPESLGKKEIKLGREKYITTSIKSEASGWKYITFTLKDRIASKTQNVRIAFFIGILLVLILGGIFIFISMNITYNPIKSLKNYSKSIFSDSKSFSELEQVKDAMVYLSDQNRILSKEVESSSEANRQYITIQMLRGSFHQDKIFTDKASKYGVFLDAFLTVAIIYVDSNADYALARKKIIQKVKENLVDDITVFSCEHFDFRKIILVLSMKSGQYENLYNSFINIQLVISKEMEITTTIGIGNNYLDKQLIPKSYLEATTAVDYRIVKGNGSIIFYSDIIEQQTALESYPRDNIQNIRVFLKAGNITSIEQELDNIINYIKTNNSPVFIAKGLCFDIINLIFQTSKEIVGDFNRGDIEIPDVFTLNGYDTVDELINIIRNLCHDFSSKIIIQKEKEDSSLIEDMVVYIQNNYTDFNFSLMGMADFFNMSQSTLSVYFKDKTNTKILNYITKMKMEKSKQLLISTGLSVNQISEAVGYTNTTSFIRRFKQWEYTTPGDYRKRYS